MYVYTQHTLFLPLFTAFESTLHEMQCSDGQYVSVLRKWNGEQFVCLPEIWRKYFPEVQYHHLCLFYTCPSYTLWRYMYFMICEMNMNSS